MVLLTIILLCAILFSIQYLLSFKEGFTSNSKESILIILSSHEMNSAFIPQIRELANYIEHLSKTYTVDIAAISSNDDFNNYAEYLDFKYTYINSKKQLSKICDFISKYKHELQYDWYIKIRPEITILDFNTIDFNILDKNAIHARARVYKGPINEKYTCSVGGEGIYSHIKECVYSELAEYTELDDNIYVFNKNIIEKNAFSTLDESANEKRQDEWFHSSTWSSRGVTLNVIGINVLHERNNQKIYSGDMV